MSDECDTLKASSAGGTGVSSSRFGSRIERVSDPRARSRFLTGAGARGAHARGIGKFPGRFAICEGPKANCLRRSCLPPTPGAPANSPNMLSLGTAMGAQRRSLGGDLKDARAASVPTTRPLGPGDVGRREPGSDAVGVERACATVGDALVCAAATSLERRLSDWPDRRRACRCWSVDRKGEHSGFSRHARGDRFSFLVTKRGKLYTCVLVLKFRKKTFFRT